MTQRQWRMMQNLSMENVRCIVGNNAKYKEGVIPEYLKEIGENIITKKGIIY
jgi:hypothetical protein